MTEPICPRCKLSMQRKKGKYGDFFGCTNYPKCNFTSKTRFLNHQNKKDFIDNVVPGDFNTRKG